MQVVNFDDFREERVKGERGREEKGVEGPGIEPLGGSEEAICEFKDSTRVRSWAC